MGTIREWPRAERPREKLLRHGAAALSDAELLAIFLRTGVAGCSAVALARQLLVDFGSLRALLGADRAQVCAVRGLGAAKYAQLQAVLEMGRRQQLQQLQRGGPLNSPERSRAFLLAELGHLRRETFGCLWLDTRHRVIDWEALASGTLDAAAVYPRQVVERALAVNAAAVIFAHNHPSGDTGASRADREITAQLREALALVSVRVLDHLIIGDGETLSFAECGWL